MEVLSGGTSFQGGERPHDDVDNSNFMHIRELYHPVHWEAAKMVYDSDDRYRRLVENFLITSVRDYNKI